MLEAAGRLPRAELDLALSGFTHPAARDSDLAWNPALALEVISRHLDAIADPGRRDLVDALRADRDATLAPMPPQAAQRRDPQRRQRLQRAGRPARAGGRPATAADRGPARLRRHAPAWIACEPAVAIAYAMLGHADPLAAAARVAAGYHRAHPLTEPEVEALWTLALIRLCTSVCLSAHRRTAEPDNAYLTISETPAWRALEAMRAIHPRLAHYTLRAACGWTPCPQAPAVEAWLAAHADEIGPVVSTDLGRTPSSWTSRSRAPSSRRPSRPPTPRS